MSDAAERIRPLAIDEEMRQSYLTYAMSVIISRALPDVRDGLKPSQRRILVAMNDLNLSPGGKFRKCAKIAGDTSGNYHPHGESVIYPTLVRLAQPFNMRYLMVDGQGNFGSIDGDPPAAMRYTEARLTHSSVDLLADLEMDTVDFTPNYDETREEPTVLPGRFPNLLCNGSVGIAVGMSTSIPPHNLLEIAAGLQRCIENPATTTEDLLALVPGPDFPTGALLCGRSEIREAYRTGRGKCTLRARHAVEERKGGRVQIVFTEIPYAQGKAAIIERIASLVEEGALPAVSDVRDESDRTGLRIVVELKRGEEATLTLNQLFERTPLQSTVSINLLALVDARPRTLDLRGMMQAYLDHRERVIRRRTRYLLEKARARAHILEGLLIAIDAIDEVIRLIRASPSIPEARAALMKRFSLSEIQANAILQMQLQRLTALERHKIEEELAKLRDEIRDFEDILARRERVLGLIREDLADLVKRYPDARRTQFTEEAADFSAEDLIPDEEMAVAISHAGYIKRMPLTSYRTQQRGGKGITGMEMKEGDFTEQLFVGSTHAFLLCFTNRGKVHWLKVYDVPQLGRAAKGRALVNMLNLAEGERVASVLAVREFAEAFLVLATRDGTVKKTPLEAFSRPKRGGIIALQVREGDDLVGAACVRPGEEMLLASQGGFAVRFDEREMRPMGRTARGVRGMRLREGDRVIAMAVAQPGTEVLSICARGYGKRTPVEEYRKTRRGGKGIVNIRASERNGPVVDVRCVRPGDQVMILSGQGMIVRTAVESIRGTGRAAQGVRVMTLQDESDRVVSVARIVADEDDRPPPAPAP